MSLIEKSIKSTFIIIVAISIFSILPRLYYFPNDIPLILDSFFYFKYAIDASILGQFPSAYLISNNGWPLFLSIFFSIYDSENFLNYMELQRIISISLSVVTISSVFLLCKRFFDVRYSLAGAIIFAFEPRVIQNSLLGITEPLFVFLTTTSMFLFLSKNQKIIFLSFAIIALGTLVRYEGVMLFFAFSIIFFIRFKKERFVIRNYLIALSIFIIILLPVQLERIETTGSDGITDSLVGATITYGSEATSSDKQIQGIISYIQNGLVNLLKLGGWTLIPSFIVFVPLGVILFFKKEKSNKVFLILTILALLLPPFYAFSRGIQETRYFIVLYPIFCILSLYSIKYFDEKFRKNVILTIIIIGILISSGLFLHLKSIDNIHEKEAFEIAKKTSQLTTVINSYHPESGYVRVTNMTDNFPRILNNEKYGPVVLEIKENKIEDFIEKNREKGLSHIVVDDKSNRNQFLRELFSDEEKYSFLIKIFDSEDMGFTYKVKIFEINYGKFDQFN
jgi:hypothetical protein